MQQAMQQQAKAVARPFVAGTRQLDRSGFDSGSFTLSTSTQDLKTYEVDPNGFLSGMWLLVEATTSGNSASVVYKEDAPFSVIDTYTLSDVNNKPLIGPLGGYDLYLINKYGGYSFAEDARQNLGSYVATTGTGGTGGTFSFCLRIPVEIVRRDALGALLNKSAAATFDQAIRIAPSTAVYSTAPTAQPSVRVRNVVLGWMDPPDTDVKGNPVAQEPPASGVTQYWHRSTYGVLASGQHSNERLNGIDALVRNMLFVLRDNSDGTRATAEGNWPDPFDLAFETGYIIRSRPRIVWRHAIVDAYGYVNAAETAGGRDKAVYPVWFNQDAGPKPGSETRFGYLPVSAATTLAWTGSLGAASNLTVLVNKVVPVGGDIVAIAGR